MSLPKSYSMKKLLFPFIAAILMLSVYSISACKPDKAVKLNLAFKATIDDEPMVFNKMYSFNGIDSFFLTKVQLLVSNITLLSPNGNVSIDKVLFVDYTRGHFTLAGATDGERFSLEDLPVGSYTGIQFTLGLDSVLNGKRPEDFSSDNPLSSGEMYWESWDSYIFEKIEGKYDTLGAVNPFGFLYHIGTNNFDKTVTLNKAFELGEGLDTQLNIKCNARGIFAGPGGSVAPRTENFTHTPLPAQDPVAYALSVKIVHNFAAAFSID